MLKRLKELEERSLTFSRKIKELEDKIAQRDKFIDGQTINDTMLKEYLKEIIKLTESNNYDNPEVIIRKINELATTAMNR